MRLQSSAQEDSQAAGGTDSSTLCVTSHRSLEGCDVFQSAMRQDYTVKRLQVEPSFFTSEGCRSPTMKHAKNLFQTLSRMVVLEEMRIYGNMSLDNVLDVQVIANAIANHPRLRIVEFRDFVVYANDHKGSKPLLEPLINAVATLKHLESFQLKCFACYKSWRRAFCSSQALKPLCRTHGVVRLDLCGIGLRDEHFRTLTEEIGSNDTTRISELLLNGNENTDVGLCDIAGLLQRNGTIERLEAHSMRRPNESTCAKILQALEKNYVLRHFLINIPHNFRSEIDFYLLLNRAGRKSMLDPKVGPAQIVNVLEAANGNVGVMMFLLRENPSLCQIQSKNVPLEEISESFINDDPPHAEETTETSTCEESEEEATPTAMDHQGVRQQQEHTRVWRGFWYEAVAFVGGASDAA